MPYYSGSPISAVGLARSLITDATLVRSSDQGVCEMVGGHHIGQGVFSPGSLLVK